MTSEKNKLYIKLSEFDGSIEEIKGYTTKKDFKKQMKKLSVLFRGDKYDTRDL